MSSTVHTADGRPGTDGHLPALRPIGAPVTEAGLARRTAEARSLAESLPARGVAAVRRASPASVTGAPIGLSAGR